MGINVASKRILQDYHAVLYKLTGVVIDFVSDSGECMTLCPAAHYNPLCNYISSCQEGKAACAQVTRENCAKARINRKKMIYECHAGLIDVVVPLFVNEQYIGSLTTGQILKSKPTAKTFRKFLDKVKLLNLDEEQLREYYFHTVVMNDQQIEALVDLISLMSEYVFESENKLIFLKSVNEGKKTQAVRHYIEQNYQKKLSVSKIAGSVFLSESRLSHLFKKETGISLVGYLNRYRIDKAKELLWQSSLSINDIANEVGFQSLPHFNRIFKDFCKISPGNYRKSRKD